MLRSNPVSEAKPKVRNNRRTKPCDVQQIDATGYVWTFLHEARDPAVIFPGAIVSTADVDEPVVAEVVDVVEEPTGKIVHLALLPGVFEDYEALVRRCIS